MLETKEGVTSDLQVEESKALLNRVLAGGQLTTSPKLQEFLRYVVECALRDAPEEVTEQQIGIHVFGRRPGYNSSDDSIVRSQARLLRMKLSVHFTTEGVNELTIIEIPKGHYLPIFRPAANRTEHVPPSSYLSSDPELSPTELLGVPQASIVESQPALNTVPVVALASSLRRLSFSKGVRVALAVGLVGLSLLAGILLGRRSLLRATIELPNQLWGPFLAADPNPTLVIYSNPVFHGTPTTGLRLAAPLESLPGSTPQSFAPLDDTYTGTGEAAAVYELTRLFDHYGAAFTLKRSRLVTWDEARSRNLIFIGASSQNTALRDLPAVTDFSISLDTAGHGYIVNQHPHPGEPTRFVAADPTQETAIVALLPGLQTGKRVLLFTGLTTIGTQAAVEFATRPENAAKLIGATGSVKGSMRPFEAVLQIGISQGVGVNARLLALHQR